MSKIGKIVVILFDIKGLEICIMKLEGGNDVFLKVG